MRFWTPAAAVSRRTTGASRRRLLAASHGAFVGVWGRAAAVDCVCSPRDSLLKITHRRNLYRRQVLLDESDNEGSGGSESEEVEEDEGEPALAEHATLPPFFAAIPGLSAAAAAGPAAATVPPRAPPRVAAPRPQQPTAPQQPSQGEQQHAAPPAPRTSSTSSLGSAGSERQLSATAFKRQRETLTAELFREFNRTVFEGRLPADLQMKWNPRLLTTAGLTHYRRDIPDDPYEQPMCVSVRHARMAVCCLCGPTPPHRPPLPPSAGPKLCCPSTSPCPLLLPTHPTCSYSARVELSSKVLDGFGKLERTLCHELCHVAGRQAGPCSAPCERHRLSPLLVGQCLGACSAATQLAANKPTATLNMPCLPPVPCPPPAAAWLVDHTAKPPHGPVFRRWADRAMARYTHLDITTCHAYEIFYPFRCAAAPSPSGWGGGLCE